MRFLSLCLAFLLACSTPTSPQPDNTTQSSSFIGPDVATLPMTGAAWTRVLSDADATWPAPNLCDQDNKADVKALAGGLVYARTGTVSYQTKVINALNVMKATQVDNCSNAVLAMGRQLGGWILAADYVGYRDPAFMAWVSQLRNRNVGGHGLWYTLNLTARVTSNNWGIWALASKTAADRYLGDTAAVTEDWNIYKSQGDGSWFYRANQDNIGTTSGYRPAWNCIPLGTPGRYRGLEQGSCTNLAGKSRNGAPVEDAARSNSDETPDPGYVTEAISGYAVQTMLLGRAGYDAWNVNTQQLKRVADFETRFGIFNWHNVAYYVAWMLNKTYGTTYPALVGNGGRMFGYTDWLYGS